MWLFWLEEGRGWVKPISTLPFLPHPPLGRNIWVSTDHLFTEYGSISSLAVPTAFPCHRFGLNIFLEIKVGWELSHNMLSDITVLSRVVEFSSDIPLHTPHTTNTTFFARFFSVVASFYHHIFIRKHFELLFPIISIFLNYFTPYFRQTYVH